ncbi:hypothetical protein MBLNU230_g1842t1 [Neophaeotheca triangularis]
MPRATRSTTKAAITAKDPATQLSSPPETPRVKSKSAKAKATPKVKSEHAAKDSATPSSSRKRSRKVKAESDDGDELPHNLGKALPSPGEAENDQAAAEPPKKRSRRPAAKTGSDESKNLVPKTEVAEDSDAPTKSTPKKSKKSQGFAPGETPYPDYPRPTPEECKEVVRLLEKAHGKVNVPKAIPPPSLDVAGCGEVPSVLDALIRTRLSANTTNKNSSTAFRGLVSKFGTLDEGIGKGSVDWDAVRRADQSEVKEAIKHGGLANVKSKDIKSILQMAYEENQQRKAALKSEEGAPTGADHEAAADKQKEVEKAEKNIISLDHIHLLSTPAAIEKMLEYPGIGFKTASCVALFCMQRPSFAVDTHVFRLCNYLGWLPKSPKKGQPKVSRDTTYHHCDALIPDEYKYPLHYLLIKHGKTCPRCQAATGQTSAKWDEGCPIEHLVTRTGAKKGGASAAARKKAKENAAEESDHASPVEGDEESELSDEAVDED